MTPAVFIDKWDATTRDQRAACQRYFIDLCDDDSHRAPNETSFPGCRLVRQPGKLVSRAGLVGRSRADTESYRPPLTHSSWVNTQSRLYEAVAADRGRRANPSDDGTLGHLLALNHERGGTKA